MPDDQIASLRVKNPAKPIHTVIEIVGARVYVRETGTLVNRMHQVGTVTICAEASLRIECGRNYGQPIILSE
jgi:hypothetical protein